MKFCPKCGSILLPQYIDKKRILKCLKCGYIEYTDFNEKIGISKTKKQKSKKKILIIDRDIKVSILPKINITCPKCGYHKAYYEIRQMRSADEPSTRFYTCIRCGYRWKEDE